MKNISMTMSILGLVILVSSEAIAADAGHAAKEAAAQAAIQKWLDLVEKQKFAETWTAASPSFQKAVSQKIWVGQIGSVKAKIGSVAKRTLTSKQYTRELPNAPRAEYVVFQFSTAFKKIGSATETVTAIRDPDGVWRAAGYFVR